MSSPRPFLTTLGMLALSTRLIPASPDPLSGGTGTTHATGREAYSQPLSHLSREHRREFAVGNSFFNNDWVTAPATAQARDGLGPLFHARSCSACHLRDGRGTTSQDPLTSLVIRLQPPHPIYGHQLATRAIPGAAPEATATLRWHTHPFTYPDGTTTELRKPQLTITDWAYGPTGEALSTSLRLAPPVFGSGLLEAITDETLTSFADPQDTDKNGISGRLHVLSSHPTSIGRFGWKATQPTLLAQTAAAFHDDIGLTTPVLPHPPHTVAQATVLGKFPHGGEPEVSAHILQRVVAYTATLAVPARRQLTDPAVLRGEIHFTQLQCHLCHRTGITTGTAHAIPELCAQRIHPYTDLLLHDMGSDLADPLADSTAASSEWRTPPLWGIGLNHAVNGHQNFLHDGRALTLEAAILWHGGEARASRDAFTALSAAQRAELLAFLHSL